jgi:hypothetical protein
MDTLARSKVQFRERRISLRVQVTLFQGSLTSSRWSGIEQELRGAFSIRYTINWLRPVKTPPLKFGTMRLARSSKLWESTREWLIIFASILTVRVWQAVQEIWRSNFGNSTRSKNSSAWRHYKGMITRYLAWSIWNPMATSCSLVLVTTLSEYGTRQVDSCCRHCSSIQNGFVGCPNQMMAIWLLQLQRTRQSSYGTWSESGRVWANRQLGWIRLTS